MILAKNDIEPVSWIQRHCRGQGSMRCEESGERDLGQQPCTNLKKSHAGFGKKKERKVVFI